VYLASEFGDSTGREGATVVVGGLLFLAEVDWGRKALRIVIGHIIGRGRNASNVKVKTGGQREII